MTTNRQRISVLVDEPTEFGRDLDGVILDDERVSRRHVRIEPMEDGRARIIDLNSSNGTRIDGEPAEGTVVVWPPALVMIGDTELQVEVHGQAAGPPDRAPRRDALPTSIDQLADAVAADLGPAPAPSTDDGALLPEVIGVEFEPGTLTIVFSDIENSTARSVEVGELPWRRVLQEHHRLVSAHVEAHRGRIVKRQGDGYMLCFRSARLALSACIGLQLDLARQMVESPEHGVHVRIGLHTGEVLADDDGDLFGRHVVIAARVGALADGGEILVSDLVKQIAEPRGDIVFADEQRAELKGLQGPFVLHRVDWANSDIAGQH